MNGKEKTFAELQAKCKDDLELSLRVINSNNLEWNFIMIRDYKINTFEHLKVIVGSNNLYWNTMCAVYFVENDKLDRNICATYANMCIDTVYKSKNEYFTSYLDEYLSDKPVFNDHIKLIRNR